MNKLLQIFDVTPDDAEEILRIYAPYVKDTAISFEYDVPSLEEFRNRIINTLKKYPYIKFVDSEGIIRGYAYAGTFNARRAYEHSCEVSIYVRTNIKIQQRKISLAYGIQTRWQIL